MLTISRISNVFVFDVFKYLAKIILLTICWMNIRNLIAILLVKYIIIGFDGKNIYSDPKSVRQI